MDASTEVHPAAKVATIVGLWSSNETRRRFLDLFDTSATVKGGGRGED